jgi:arginyl-tRNA synthetase
MSVDGQNYRFITDDNLTTARLSIAKAVQNVIAQGLGIMGVKAIDKM